jgi:hypothetical protein
MVGNEEQQMSELLEVRRSEYYSPSRRKSEFYSDSRNRHVWVASVFQGEKKIDIFCDGPMEATMYKFAPESVEKIEIGKIRFAGDFEQYGIKTDKDLDKAYEEERLEWHDVPYFDLYDSETGESYEFIGWDVDEAILIAGEVIAELRSRP